MPKAIRQSRISGKTASRGLSGFKGKADPNDYSLRIRYQNFRGNEIIYSADPRTAYQQNEYVVVRLAPTGKRVSFKLARIQNRERCGIDLERETRSQPEMNAESFTIICAMARRRRHLKSCARNIRIIRINTCRRRTEERKMQARGESLSFGQAFSGEPTP